MPSNESRMTKTDRRDAAREKARQLREEQVKREKRNRLLIIGGVVAFLVVVGIAVYSIISAGNQPVIEDVANVPDNAAVEDGGISVGEGLAAGTTNEGAPVIDIYQDYTCIHCSNFESINGEDLTELAESGDATVVYHPIALLGDRDQLNRFSARAVHAAGTVADQAPEQFLDANAALFELYDAAREAGGSEPDAAAIRQALTDAGVPEDVAAEAVPEDMTEGAFTEWVQATTEQATKDGISGTPTIFLDGENFDTWTQEGALAEAAREA